MPDWRGQDSAANPPRGLTQAKSPWLVGARGFLCSLNRLTEVSRSQVDHSPGVGPDRVAPWASRRMKTLMESAVPSPLRSMSA